MKETVTYDIIKINGTILLATKDYGLFTLDEFILGSNKATLTFQSYELEVTELETIKVPIRNVTVKNYE